MGRLKYFIVILSIIFLLEGCTLRDWIRSENEYVGVEEFKRITKVVKEGDKSNGNIIFERQRYTEVSQLFNLIAVYNQATPQEKKVLFNSVNHSFEQNPTLLNALFLSMIEVTNTKNKNKLTINSNLMNAIDFSKADPDLVQLMKLFEVLNVEKSEKLELKNKVKLYQVENSKFKKVVNELNSQINALKNIDESIFARELVQDNQE